MPGKYALCIWGELRGVNAIVKSLYENVIDPLSVDIYVVCQRAFDNDDEIVKAFTHNVKEVNLYNKPNPSEYLGEYYTDVYNKIRIHPHNWIDNPAVTQQYINFHKIAVEYGTTLAHNYDYVIFTRSDMYFTHPFPDIYNLTADRDSLWTLSTSEYNGIHYNLIVIPQKHIITYLNGAYNILTNKDLLYNVYKKYNFRIPYAYNSESFMKHIVDSNKMRVNSIDINAFISANKITDKNTWTAKINYDPVKKLLYKYAIQYENAFKDKNKWDNGARWKYVENTDGSASIILA